MGPAAVDAAGLAALRLQVLAAAADARSLALTCLGNVAEAAALLALAWSRSHMPHTQLQAKQQDSFRRERFGES